MHPARPPVGSTDLIVTHTLALADLGRHHDLTTRVPTVVHHLDGVLAVGADLPVVDPAIAADGIDELVTVMLSGVPEWAVSTGPHIACTVASCPSWLVSAPATARRRVRPELRGSSTTRDETFRRRRTVRNTDE